jgi:mannose-6-phosphate isomerase-like protein (cupin superfamily)
MTDLVTSGRVAAPVDVAAVEADWAGRGYDCHHFRDPPGRTWSDFVHDTNEVVTVVSGRLWLSIGGEAVTAGPGDEVFIPRGAVHTVKNVDSGETHWLFGYD